MTVRSYNDFAIIAKRLEDWNPNTQYISKDLTLKSKPKRTTCCQRFFSIFRTSKSSQAVSVAKTINVYAEQYKTELAKDRDTLKTLNKFNKSILKNLVEKDAPHGLRNRKKRNDLQGHCEAINTFCLKLLKNGEACSSKYSSLSEKTTVETKKSHDSAETSKSKKTFQNPKELKKFIAYMKPSSAREATELLNDLKDALANSNLAIVLDENNGNALLVKIREIKHQFIDSANKQAEPKLRKAALNLRIEIRKRFFADRIKKMSAQVKIIESNIDETLRVDGAVFEVIGGWKKDLKKFKPIAIPKYFHCTTSDYVNKIIRDRVGIVEQPVEVRGTGHAGAFVSSIPETFYGPFCFAVSDYVEERALADKRAPIITNVNYFADLGRYQYDREPIYVGHAAPYTKKIHRGQPKIWFGFQQSIHLRKPDKSKNPLEYYRNTTFALFSYSVDKSDAIKASNLRDLKERNIRVLAEEDFIEIVDLVQRSLHFVVPKEWKDEAKTPMDCALIQVQFPYKHMYPSYNGIVPQEVPIQYIQGAQA